MRTLRGAGGPHTIKYSIALGPWGHHYPVTYTKICVNLCNLWSNGLQYLITPVAHPTGRRGTHTIKYSIALWPRWGHHYPVTYTKICVNLCNLWSNGLQYLITPVAHPTGRRGTHTIKYSIALWPRWGLHYPVTYTKICVNLCNLWSNGLQYPITPVAHPTGRRGTHTIKYSIALWPRWGHHYPVTYTKICVNLCNLWSNGLQYPITPVAHPTGRRGTHTIKYSIALWPRWGLHNPLTS